MSLKNYRLISMNTDFLHRVRGFIRNKQLNFQSAGPEAIVGTFTKFSFSVSFCPPFKPETAWPFHKCPFDKVNYSRGLRDTVTMKKDPFEKDCKKTLKTCLLPRVCSATDLFTHAGFFFAFFF